MVLYVYEVKGVFIVEYSTEELLKFLSLANKKLKKLKRNVKNIRIERNKYKKKLQEIERCLAEKTCYFDRYDYPSNSEVDELNGKLKLKEEILNIINK